MSCGTCTTGTGVFLVTVTVLVSLKPSEGIEYVVTTVSADSLGGATVRTGKLPVRDPSYAGDSEDANVIGRGESDSGEPVTNSPDTSGISTVVTHAVAGVSNIVGASVTETLLAVTVTS